MSLCQCIYIFGLWRVCFPPVLIRPARRLPVEVRRGGVWVALTLDLRIHSVLLCFINTRADAGGIFFGLWRVCFPPCLVRPGRRLPVQGLISEGLWSLENLLCEG